MRRFKLTLILLFAVVFNLLAGNISQFSWKKYNLVQNEQAFFLCGKSQNNFYVQTKNGLLFNIIDGKIKKKTPPKSIRYIEANYYAFANNNFFCSIITPDWKGEIYRIENDVWEKYDIETKAPLRYFYKTENNLYLIGDFGLLLKFKNNKWKIIETPFESHIISALVDSNNLLLATRNDGLIKFDGEHFIFLSKNSKIKNIVSIKYINDTLYAISNNNKVIKYYNSTFYEVENNEILKYFISKESAKFGFIERNIFYNNKRITLSFPQNYNVFSRTIGRDNIIILEDKTIILFSDDGNIFLSQKPKESTFVNLATIYKIDDLPNSYNTGTQFFDANNDGVNDLLVLSRNFGNYLSLYQGVKNSAFANITSISNLPFRDTKISFITITDFNKDYKKDIIIESRIDSLHKLLIYQNLGNFNFKKISEIVLPHDLQQMGIRNLSTFDYDKDGDDDIIVTSYYGKGNMPGYVLIYKNNYWGNFDEIDSTFKSFPRRWNENFIFADMSNNDTLDIFNTTLWTNDHLIMGSDSGYVDKTETHFVLQKKTETINALLSDFDNDGDLDIFTSGRNDFIRVYLNNGKGHFTEITSKLFNNFIAKKRIVKSSTNLNIGDFNNDSFTDILISLYFSDTSYTTLFINNKGKEFIETPICFEPNNTVVTYSTISDFDNDGDLDIYATTSKHNAFLLNGLDKNNFVKLKLKGIISSTSALGSKVWIYKNGKLGNNNFLIGYKELGSEVYRRNSANNLTLHFGLGKNKNCDIKVKFLSGKEINLTNVSAGSTLTIDEVPFIYSIFYKLPGNIYRFISNTENQLYILVILFSHIMLILGLWYGNKKLQWSLQLTIVFAMLNISLFWMSLYFASFSSVTFTKFLIPLLLTLIVTTIPIVLFLWINKSNKKDIVAHNEKLLKLVMQFSHGKWALRNLNSILLLCENSPSNWRDNQDFYSKLDVRFKTFSKMTSVSILEIIELEKLSGNKSEEFELLEKSLNDAIEHIKNFKNEKSLQQIIDNFSIIRSNLKEFRDNVYSRFSSNPTEVINDMIENFNSIFEKNKIKIQKSKKYPNEISVLIKNYELADILDNLFQNSIRFMGNSKEKKISIELYKESPKIILNYSNSGSIIPKDIWDVIFEQGYSGGGGTGQGLYSARETVKKYGGRIIVSDSTLEKTTFKIELNEGVKEMS